MRHHGRVERGRRESRPRGMAGSVRRGSLAVVAAVACLPACTSDPAPTAGLRTVATSGLRGALAGPSSCIRVEKQPYVTEPVEALVPVDAVSSLTVCRQPGAIGSDRNLTPGQQSFKTLVAALARPNDTTTNRNQICLTYADSLIQVLARTPTGVYWLEVPHDMCGHYLRRPVDSLTAAFG